MHDEVEDGVWKTSCLSAFSRGSVLYALIACTAIQERESTMLPVPMAEFHVNASKRRELGCSSMAASMSHHQIAFANTHPDPIDVAQEPYRSKLSFVLGTSLRNQGDEGVANWFRPSPGVFPIVHEFD